jgi:hypothetical protein
MPNNKIWKKGLAVGIIILFVGVAVASGITFKTDSSNTMQTEVSNDELVKISISICKINSVEDYEVSLTQQQVEELDNLVDNIKPELDKVETRVETVRLFRDIILSLDKLGMLPEDMSVLEALRLVTGNLYFLNPRNIFNLKPETYIDKGNTQPLCGEIDNTYCQIVAKASNSGRTLLPSFPPVFIFYVGEYCWDFKDIYDYPAEGWVWTNGNKGKQCIEGKLKGDMGFSGFTNLKDGLPYYAECYGYAGGCPFLGIYLPWRNLWIGYAEVVKIAYW